MTVYLEHRLEKSRLGQLAGVCVCQTEQQWIFEDIASELLALFPSAEVWSSDEAARRACRLAIVPYLDQGHTISQKRAAVGRVLGFMPEFIGFYELGRRRFVVVAAPDRAVAVEIETAGYPGVRRRGEGVRLSLIHI